MGTQEFSARHRSMLRAVAQGRGQLTCERNPCLRVDGRWCDQMATADLVRRGLIGLATGTTTSEGVGLAVLTGAGAVALAA